MEGFKSVNRRKSDLLYICCQSPKYRKKLLTHADPELVKCIGTCVTKVLDGSVPLSTAETNKLKKYKKALRKIKSTAPAKRKQAIIQSGGGFLLSLIPAVVGALASLIR